MNLLDRHIIEHEEDEDHGRHPLVIRDIESARIGGTDESDERGARDIGCEERESDGRPPELPPGQEEIFAALLSSTESQTDGQHDTEIDDDDAEVDIAQLERKILFHVSSLAAGSGHDFVTALHKLSFGFEIL